MLQEIEATEWLDLIKKYVQYLSKYIIGSETRIGRRILQKEQVYARKPHINNNQEIHTLKHIHRSSGETRSKGILPSDWNHSTT